MVKRIFVQPRLNKEECFKQVSKSQNVNHFRLWQYMVDLRNIESRSSGRLVNEILLTSKPSCDEKGHRMIRIRLCIYKFLRVPNHDLR